LVDREGLRARPDELEHRVRAPADPDLADHGEDHVLSRHEGPRFAGELDLDRVREGLPDRAEREAGGDVGGPEPRPERAERAVGARVRVAARNHGAGHDPPFLAEQRVLDATATLAVERDTLLVRP